MAIIILGIVALVVNLFILIGNIWCTPIVMAMLRRSEVLMVLIIDVTYYHIFPDIVESIGYVLVLSSLVGMTMADEIQDWICPDRQKVKFEPLVNAKESQSSGM